MDELFILLSKAHPSIYALDHIPSTVSNIPSHYLVSTIKRSAKIFWFCNPSPQHYPGCASTRVKLLVWVIYASFPQFLYLNLIEIYLTCSGFYYPPSQCSESPFGKVTSNFQIAKIHRSILSLQLDLSFVLTNNQKSKIKQCT